MPAIPTPHTDGNWRWAMASDATVAQPWRTPARALGEPLCLIGDSGRGKSHLLIALGTEAPMNGFRVLATTLVNKLVEAADEKQGGRPRRAKRPVAIVVSRKQRSAVY
jgi:chromosomal replication initiation ATPase DnaA